MDLADEGHVLVSDAVFGVLSQREKYMGVFRPFDAVVKHRLQLRVHQFVGEYPGLSTSCPSTFSPGLEAESSLSRLEAFYLAHALQHREFLQRQDPRGMTRSAATVLLYFRAQDSTAAERLLPGDVLRVSAHGGPDAPIADQFAYYTRTDFDLCFGLAERIENQLSRRANLFEGRTFLFVSSAGIQKLKADCPDIWETFELGGAA